MGWILGEKSDTVAPHKAFIKALWETKMEVRSWSVYPFHDGRLEDFEPIFETLIAKATDDAYSDDYTATFLPIA
ncbi:hypothetical protein BDW69DRAFT_185930 [Aspergillus filifer]